MAIKYKTHKDYNNNIVSCSKWEDTTFLLAIPFDEANTDYQEYLKWLNGEDPYTEKGTPEAAD